MSTFNIPSSKTNFDKFNQVISVSYHRISVNIVSSYEEVVVCLDFYFCQMSVYVNEKGMVVSFIDPTRKLSVDNVELSILEDEDVAFHYT